MAVVCFIYVTHPLFFFGCSLIYITTIYSSPPPPLPFFDFVKLFSVPTGKKEHALHLCGIFVGSVPVLVRAQLNVDPQAGCILKVRLKKTKNMLQNTAKEKRNKNAWCMFARILRTPKQVGAVVRGVSAL